MQLTRAWSSRKPLPVEPPLRPSSLPSGRVTTVACGCTAVKTCIPPIPGTGSTAEMIPVIGLTKRSSRARVCAGGQVRWPPSPEKRVGSLSRSGGVSCSPNAGGLSSRGGTIRSTAWWAKRRSWVS